jgi:excisionase family DNA binding protein
VWSRPDHPAENPNLAALVPQMVVGRQSSRNKPLLDVADAAAYLSVAPGYLRRLVRERRIAHHHVGKFLRFDLGDLEGFIQAGRVAP